MAEVLHKSSSTINTSNGQRELFSSYHQGKIIIFRSNFEKNSWDRWLIGCAKSPSLYRIYHSMYPTEKPIVEWLHFHIVLDYAQQKSFVLQSTLIHLHELHDYYAADLGMLIKIFSISEGEMLVKLLLPSQ